MNSYNQMYDSNWVPPAIKERGVVLFIALVALVVMSLAAVALIRSVDTSTIIAGNLAFKQSATISADSGLESGAAWLSANSASLNNSNVVAGYRATYVGLSLMNDATWAAGSSAPATGSDIDGAGKDASGNTIRYVIERMCTATGLPTAASCLFGAPEVDPNSKGSKDAPRAGGTPPKALSVMYRVTARVTGPQNTVSFVQAFVY